MLEVSIRVILIFGTNHNCANIVMNELILASVVLAILITQVINAKGTKEQ